MRAIAQTGLHYATDPFDRERYERLLALATREYAERVGTRRRRRARPLRAGLGYVTAKVGADAAVFDEDDRILLVRRVDDGKWGLIAGWVDPNESPEQTVVRELAEEVGLDGARSTGSSACSRATPAPTATRTASCRSCTSADVTGGELRAPAARGRARSRGATIDDVEPDWHHHHETLARAAREAHWRRVVDG